MSHKKSCTVHVWFLDNDLEKSAQMLTDKCLNKTINACVNCIVSVHMHLMGIRSKKFYSHFFSKENMQETMSSKFTGWPLKSKPSFNAYQWKESRWCRMCHENLDLMVDYLSALLDEHIWRCSRSHPAQSVLDWVKSDEILLDFPYAGLTEVVLPWKSVDPKYRTEDIITGYRSQFCATQIEDGDAFAAYANCRRDIPDFIVETFNLCSAFEH